MPPSWKRTAMGTNGLSGGWPCRIWRRGCSRRQPNKAEEGRHLYMTVHRLFAVGIPALLLAAGTVYSQSPAPARQPPAAGPADLPTVAPVTDCAMLAQADFT